MANTPRNLARLAGAMALGAAFAASAADPAPAPELISGASAQMLAETCAGCHGTDGASAGPASPTIGGMHDETFTEVMEGFRDGSIYSTVMGRIAKGYSDEEIELMAKYFAGKPYQPVKQEFDVALAEKGAKLHDKYCEKCHSEGGKLAERRGIRPPRRPVDPLSAQRHVRFPRRPPRDAEEDEEQARRPALQRR